MSAPLIVLGGGPAGLATAYYATKRGRAVRLFEAAERAGGNCITLQHGEFRFDSGAHRFHDKDPEITAEVKHLLGDDLRPVRVPSAVHLDGRFLEFPPAPFDLLRHLGPMRFGAAAFGALTARFRVSARAAEHDLESYATRAYGASLARLFLLNYSQKLWGIPCAQLSPSASGGRLSGLRLSALFRRLAPRPAHMEGAFYYPRTGYGAIVDALAGACGPGTIHTEARVTRVVRDGRRVVAVDVDGAGTVPIDDRVVSTLPLGVLARAIDPPLPAEVLAAARAVRFRSLVLVVLMIDRPSITPYASVYFPDARVPFTRVSEPRNRSAEMSPVGKTSLMVEMPCDTGDEVWTADEATLVGRVLPTLERLGWVSKRSILATSIVRLSNAYPVLDLQAERAAEDVVRHLRGIDNLVLLGRNGLFRYTWLHGVMRMAKDAVDALP